MRYEEIKPQKATDITQITPIQLAAQDAQALPVKSDRQLHGAVQRKLSVDIANDAQQTTAPTNFDKMMAFRRYCFAKNAANKDALDQQRKAQAWVKAGRQSRGKE